MFRLPQTVHPFHVNDVIRHYSHPERSPGLPYTTEGLKRKDEVDPNRIKWAVHAMKYGIWPKCRTPCNAVAKTAVHPTDEKLRLIWVYPAHMTFGEGMFAMPLIHAYKQQQKNYAIWLRYHCGDMRYMYSVKPPGYTWLAADWSSFYATVPAWLIRDAFAILRENLDFARYQFRGLPTDKESLPRLWKCIINYFINTPIKCPDGKVLVTNAGVPSGSYFTNLIDSLVNCIVVHYLLLTMEMSYSHTAFWVMGDDLLVAISDAKLDLNALAATAKTTFGLELNVEKSEVGEFPNFLGYTMSRNGVPGSNYDRLMAQLCLPSRPDRTLEEFCARIRALQLASFGGNKPFLYETQNWLDYIGMSNPPPLRKRDELNTKLEALGLAGWPPLERVLLI